MNWEKGLDRTIIFLLTSLNVLFIFFIAYKGYSPHPAVFLFLGFLSIATFLIWKLLFLCGQWIIDGFKKPSGTDTHQA